MSVAYDSHTTVRDTHICCIHTEMCAYGRYSRHLCGAWAKRIPMPCPSNQTGTPREPSSGLKCEVQFGDQIVDAFDSNR